MFVVFIILALIALIALVVTPFLPRESDYGSVGPRVWGIGVTAVVSVLAVICLIIASLTQVGTKEVGVVTSFGKPTGYIENGIHWKKPWAKVHILNDALQTDTYDQATDKNSIGNCIDVRIARQATSCVDVSIAWQIKPSGVDYLFRNYKNNDAIQNNLVEKRLQSALNENMAKYDPLAVDANGVSTELPLNSADGNSVSLEVLNQMRSEIGQWVTVQSVFIPLQHFDSGTQARLNQIQAQIAATRVAQQSLQTAKANAAANAALAQSVSNDPGVLTSRCLDIQRELVDKGGSLTGAPSCFTASGSATVVPVK